jgi:hypothetical protein
MACLGERRDHIGFPGTAYLRRREVPDCGDGEAGCGFDLAVLSRHATPSVFRQPLAELGLIDEYEFVVHPSLAGHGPTLFAGLSKRIDLKLVSRLELASGAVAMRYEPRR